MDSVIDDGSFDVAEVELVLRDSRKRFIVSLPGHCDTLDALAGGAPAKESVDAARKVLHRLAGLSGTLGFARTSAEAARFEDAVSGSPAIADTLRAAAAALRQAFASDLTDAAPEWSQPVLSTRALSVMLIEDEPVQRKVLAAQLRQLGHEPIEASSGEAAVEMARRSAPDVILLDVEMPGMNGHAVCRVLKADPALASIPVAFLSSHTGLDERLKGLAIGADDFLTKPIDPRELALRLQLLQKRTPTAEGRGAREVMSFEAFSDAARPALQRNMAALAIVRAPVHRLDEVAASLRDEIRVRDLCGLYDRGHLLVLLPETSGPLAKDRMAALIDKGRAAGVTGVHAGIAVSSHAGARTLEELLEEGDEALAIARYESIPAAQRPDGPRSEARSEQSAPLVLVGDDDPEVIRIIDAHLAAAGYRRLLAFDGTRTVEEVRAHRPQVLIVDLMMPRMTGFDVLAALRDMTEGRPRIIVLSARGREEDIIKAFNLGADDYITKPFNPQELLARIGRLLR
jgi:DNA-binding response OmpR family regulator/HPt (histidine-containing phosphotransfer) domain-containing protein